MLDISGDSTIARRRSAYCYHHILLNGNDIILDFACVHRCKWCVFGGACIISADDTKVSTSPSCMDCAASLDGEGLGALHSIDKADTTRRRYFASCYPCKRVLNVPSSFAQIIVQHLALFRREGVPHNAPLKRIVSLCTGRSRPCRYLLVTATLLCLAWSRAITMPSELARSRMPESLSE